MGQNALTVKNTFWIPLSKLSPDRHCLTYSVENQPASAKSEEPKAERIRELFTLWPVTQGENNLTVGAINQ